MLAEIDYHMQRSRRERELAYRSGVGAVADAHTGLAELHLQRALALHHVQQAPLGNVTPLWPATGRVRLGKQNRRSRMPATA